MEPRNADQIISTLAERIKVLEIERAYLIDDIINLKKDDENVKQTGVTNKVK